VPEQPRDLLPGAPDDAANRFVEENLVEGQPIAGPQLWGTAVGLGPEGRRRRKGLGFAAWLAIGWMVFIVGVAVLSQLGVLPVGSPTDVVASCARKGPFATEGTAPGFLLGCDSNGRDMVARLAYGSWSSLVVSTGAVAFGFLIGGFFGLVAGYIGGKFDTFITGAFNVLLSIPAIVLALALVAFLQASTKGVSGNDGGFFHDPKVILILAIGVVSVPLLGRITRASALSWSQREFVLAAKAQGAKTGRIMVREVLPNVLPAMFSIALLGIAVAIVAEGTLAILGVGVKPPTPSWGNIIAQERGNLNDSPHMVFEPALLIFLTVLALNYLGDVVRARLDVREAGI
jgi:peptide/nickel transport system permease protein